MTRDIFLKELRIALQGQVSQARVNEHLRYYENYIMEESRKGRTEEEVIRALGNPRLIAKTIIETTEKRDFKENDQKTADNRSYQKADTEKQKGFHINFDERTGWDVRYGSFKINSWYGYLLLGIIAVVVLILLAKISMVLIPVILPLILVIILLYLLFYGNRK